MNYNKYLEGFVFSKELRKHLLETTDSVANIADIIFCSPVPVDRKLDALQKLSVEIKDSEDTSLIESCKKYIFEIEYGLNALNQDGTFTLERGYFDTVREEKPICLEGVYASFEDAFDCIKDNRESDNEHAAPVWYIVTKWAKNSEGKFDEVCSAYIKVGKIFFIDTKQISALFESQNLNISVPFKTGDIVRIDGYPFSGRDYYLITDVGDNKDCCSLQGLHIDKNGNMTKGAIKHCYVGKQDLPRISLLYFMETYTGELPKHQEGYRAIQELIRDFKWVNNNNFSATT